MENQKLNVDRRAFAKTLAVHRKTVKRQWEQSAPAPVATPSLDLLTTLFNQILAHEGAEAGTQLIKDELQRNPTLLGLDPSWAVTAAREVAHESEAEARIGFSIEKHTMK